MSDGTKGAASQAGLIQPLRQLEGRVAALALANIDTDQLIPARFMKRPRAQGYGGFLLHDLRFDAEGHVRPGAPLAGGPAAILVSRRNFGCGSSREAAVYALADFGVRCVIAPSFGDIFAANAVKNGLLPAQVTEDDAEALMAFAGEAEGRRLGVDLEAQTLSAGARRFRFEIDAVWRLQLLNGWDDIDLTRAHGEAIAAFAARDAAARPWAVPADD